MSGSAPSTPDRAEPSAAPGPTVSDDPVDLRWRRAAELAAVVAALAAIVFGLLELRPEPTPGSAAPPTTSPRSTGPGGGTTGPSLTTQPAGRPDRYLTELTPAVGGSLVQRVGANSLRMSCGTGESDDREREVTYDIPRSGYRSFGTAAAVSGERETRVQVFVLVDNRVVTEPVVTAGGTQRLTWTGDGLVRLTLRIACEPGATRVTFTDPGLTR